MLLFYPSSLIFSCICSFFLRPASLPTVNSSVIPVLSFLFFLLLSVSRPPFSLYSYFFLSFITFLPSLNPSVLFLQSILLLFDFIMRRFMSSVHPFYAIFLSSFSPSIHPFIRVNFHPFASLDHSSHPSFLSTFSHSIPPSIHQCKFLPVLPTFHFSFHQPVFLLVPYFHLLSSAHLSSQSSFPPSVLPYVASSNYQSTIFFLFSILPYTHRHEIVR